MEFCRAQQEVRPWIQTFQAQHGRKPSLQDALESNDTLIAERFQCYQTHKDALTSDIPTLRDSLAGHVTGCVGPRTARLRRGDTVNGNLSSVNAAEATARVRAAMNYRKLQSRDDSVPQQAAAKAVAPGSAARVKVLQAKLEGSGPSAHPRAKTALLKAMQYKQGRVAQTEKSEACDGCSDPRIPSASAVQLVSVEGKAIGGVDYSSIDSTASAAGESHLIQAGRMPVTSYRNVECMRSSGSTGLSDSCAAFTDADEVFPHHEAVHAHGVPISHACRQSSNQALSAVYGVTSPARLFAEGFLTICTAKYRNPELGCRQDEQTWSIENRGISDNAPAASLEGLGSHSSSVTTGVVCPNVEPAATGVHCRTAVALIELRGKQAVATEAVKASATAAVLALTCADDVPVFLSNESGGLVSRAFAAASRAEQVHLEFDEARQAVMQLLRDGADTYCGGLMLLRRFL